MRMIKIDFEKKINESKRMMNYRKLYTGTDKKMFMNSSLLLHKKQNM